MSSAIRTAAIVSFLLAASSADARRPRRAVLPVPAPLVGSSDSLARENEFADDEMLPRIADLDELRRMIGDGTLVAVKESRHIVFDKDLGILDPGHAELYRCARPWVAKFLADFGPEARRALGRRLVIASLVRTEPYQSDLVKINSSAAAGTTPETRSTHLTGSTVDISTKGLSWRQIRWLQRRLLAFEDAGRVQATQERHTRCFHVMVFPGYGGVRPPKPVKPSTALPNDHQCTPR